jgi:hypothetical protein
MKAVKMFEEFLSDPAQEASLKKQFTTSAVTANVPVTHSVSTIVSDETGMHTVIGDQNKVAEIVAVVVAPEGTN